MTITPLGRPLRCDCGKCLARLRRQRGQPPRLTVDPFGTLTVEAEPGRLYLTCRRCKRVRGWPE